MYNVTFKNIGSIKIRKAFLKALEGYPILQRHDLLVVRKPIKKTTMRAQPIIDNFIFDTKNRRYKIEISNHLNLSRYIKIEKLPANVLIGWFAHELGHVMDYQTRKVGNLIKFAIGYLFLPTFRLGAERRADVFAIEAGYAKEILATKKYILEKSKLPNKYKERIEKYYLSPEEVNFLHEGRLQDLALDRLL